MHAPCFSIYFHRCSLRFYLSADPSSGRACWRFGLDRIASSSLTSRLHSPSGNFAMHAKHLFFMLFFSRGFRLGNPLRWFSFFLGAPVRGSHQFLCHGILRGNKAFVFVLLSQVVAGISVTMKRSFDTLPVITDISVTIALVIDSQKFVVTGFSVTKEYLLLVCITEISVTTSKSL